MILLFLSPVFMFVFVLLVHMVFGVSFPPVCAAAAVAVAMKPPPAQGSDPHNRIPHKEFFIFGL